MCVSISLRISFIPFESAIRSYNAILPTAALNENFLKYKAGDE